MGLLKLTHSARSEEMLYMRDMHQAMVAEKQHVIGITLILLLACLGVALFWADHYRLEEITRGSAKVIPSSREQIIQSLEGGILSELLVKEGDVVEQGQALLKIDPTKANASYQEGQNKAVALRATAARLRAEARGTRLQFSEDVNKLAELVANETNTYQAKRQAVEQSIATIKRSKDLIGRELAMTEPMAAKGLVSEIELLRMRRQFNDLELQIQERFNKYRADAANELNKVEAELSQTTEVVGARQDLVKRTTINAPLRGTVKNIRMNTIGGVVQPAQDIMEIVPLEDRLLVEAKIRPHDVAFLRPGLPATVKISAYDYSIYGGLDGEIEMISPDTLREERKTEDENYYRVLVRTKKSTLLNNGKELPIIPGMTANVEIRTGEKSVLDYILKPVLKAREAMRER
jgi:membrane fusion protein, adhesin transport system